MTPKKERIKGRSPKANKEQLKSQVWIFETTKESYVLTQGAREQVIPKKVWVVKKMSIDLNPKAEGVPGTQVE